MSQQLQVILFCFLYLESTDVIVCLTADQFESKQTNQQEQMLSQNSASMHQNNESLANLLFSNQSIQNKLIANQKDEASIEQMINQSSQSQKVKYHGKEPQVLDESLHEKLQLEQQDTNSLEFMKQHILNIESIAMKEISTLKKDIEKQRQNSQSVAVQMKEMASNYEKKLGECSEEIKLLKKSLKEQIQINKLLLSQILEKQNSKVKDQVGNDNNKENVQFLQNLNTNQERGMKQSASKKPPRYYKKQIVSSQL